MFWVPQQAWRFRTIPFGIITVCFHANHWSTAAMTQFAKDVAARRRSITELELVKKKFGDRRMTILDRIIYQALGKRREV